MTETSAVRKTRGAFFTPPEITDFITKWAVRSPSDDVLEPACGEAAFLISAGERLRALGSRNPFPSQLQGVEIHPESVSQAEKSLRNHGFSAAIKQANFFDLAPLFDFHPPQCDAILGNPPYIRYQSFSGEFRLKSQQAALAQGVRLPGLASSWAAFVVHSARFLKKDGRLGLVLPAELLTANYAGPVRRFPMKRFASVRLVVFEERVFPDVLEEVVLLLAEGTGPTDHCDLYQAKDLRRLTAPKARSWFPRNAEDKWTQAFLPKGVFEIYSKLTSSRTLVELLNWGETYLGIVTGNNRYFCLTSDEAMRISIRSSELLQISPPSSRHLRGLNFTTKAWLEMTGDGSRTLLFYPRGKPSSAALRYIETGEKSNTQEAYKCRVRSPWWRVPLVPVPDLFLTYMNYDTPRLVTNRAGVHHLNSIHGVTLKREHRQLGMDLLPIASLNSVTLLGAELVGRSYGGGILKIEPREADRLPVPSPTVLERAASDLRALRPQLVQFLRRGELGEVVKKVDRILLTRYLRVSRKEIFSLREAKEVLFTRRIARSGKNGKNRKASSGGT